MRYSVLVLVGILSAIVLASTAYSQSCTCSGHPYGYGGGCCDPAQGSPCGNCGTIACDSSCVGEGVCSPSSTQCVTGVYQVCSAACAWVDSGTDSDGDGVDLECEDSEDGAGSGGGGAPGGGSGGTTCDSAQSVCYVAVGGKCSAQQNDESWCDDLDNDCDLTTDEGCNDDGDGYCDSAYVHLGAAICGSGGDDCDDTNANVYPGATEACDSIDNNCDFTIDESCSCSLSSIHGNGDGNTRSCGTSAGACSTGTQTCTGGVWSSCVGDVGPSGEVCDGVDNNCNGRVDEGCSCTNGNTLPCGSDVGACQAGIQTCSGDTWGFCVGEVGPSTEICDNIDNNCDGTIDEGCDDDGDGYADDGTTCSGSFLDGNGVVQSCSTNDNDCNDVDAAINPGATDVCTDGIDNNCDGATDCEDANCFATLQGTVTELGTGDPVDNAKIGLLNVTYTEIHDGFTGVTGFYTMTVSCGTYNLQGSHEDYIPNLIPNVVLPPQGSVTQDLTLQFGQVCEDDCTFSNDEIVHATCDGVNDCAFYDDTAKAVCDNAQVGWIRSYNSTHEVECGEGAPVESVQVEASVSCEGDNLVKTTRLVNYKGELVRMVVVTCG